MVRGRHTERTELAYCIDPRTRRSFERRAAVAIPQPHKLQQAAIATIHRVTTITFTSNPEAGPARAPLPVFKTTLPRKSSIDQGRATLCARDYGWGACARRRSDNLSTGSKPRI